jgi:hypothetical protein
VSATSNPSRVRLLIGGGCAAALGCFYAGAFASAWAFGTFTGFAHPWQSLGTDVLLLSLCALTLVMVSPVVWSASGRQRLIALLLASLPSVVLIHFWIWVCQK